MSYQGIFAVSDLHLEKTYEGLEGKKEISHVLPISKGSFTFWIKVDNQNVRVQISRNHVNIWHKSEKYVVKAFQNLKKMLLDYEGKECEYTVLQNMQQIGSLPISFQVSTKVELSKKYDKADEKVVSKCVEIINSTENKNLLHSRLEQLRRFAWDTRIGIYEEVLTCLEKCFENPLVYDDVENYRLAIEICRAIIIVENRVGDSQSNLAIDKVKNQISLKVIDLVEKKTELLKYSIYFLADSGKKEAVELFFEFINDNPTTALQGVVDSLLFDFSRAIAKLYKDYFSEIDSHLDKMVTSENERKNEAGLQLRKKMQENLSSQIPF